jgi:DNA-binding NtrC family response regulator
VTSGAAGIVAVRVPEGGAVAVVEHLGRRVEQSGLSACVAVGGQGAPAFHLAARALRVPKASDARVLAETLGTAAARRRTVVLAVAPAEGTWDRAVVNELCADVRGALVVLVSERDESWLGAETFEVSDSLDDSERHRYLAAAVEHEARKSQLRSVRDLSVFAARLAAPATTRAPLSGAAAALLASLVLAGRPWPVAELPQLGETPVEALAELVDRGFVAERDGVVRLVAKPPSTVETSSARVADALLSTFPGDAWAEARAAELVLGHDAERADALHVAALDKLSDPMARRELRRRWMQAARSDRSLMMRSAHRALEAGEPEEALRCIEATGSGERPAEHALLMGRALVGSGDLVGGKVAFERARAADAAREHASAIAVELAEVAYAHGAFDAAREEAASVLRDASATRLCLRASNVLGKILLADGKWDEADAHFANDAMNARAAGHMSENLRARLNRAIAIQSKGLVDEANTMLRAVLVDAEENADERAYAYALTNLAVVAWTRRDYATALDCLERTFAIFRALGSAATAAHTVASLADLRLRLGLLDHASQTIAFGRRADLSPIRAAQFAHVASRIALAKGDLVTARKEMESAIAEASASGDVELLSDAHRLAARVTLEEGDVNACKMHVSTAEPLAKTDRARAETLLLGALAARASGKRDLDLAREALRVARAAGDDDVLCEVLVLLSLLHRDAEDQTSARAFCEQAIAVRNGVADGLPPHVRAAFLARAESVALSRMQTALAPASDDVVEAPRTERSPRIQLNEPSQRRELVGDDPQIRTLLASIKKVGRSDATVLIKGESGTGKELVADALHRASDRANGPLVSVNCAALVETLLLSELFGHEKGAFTGAASRRRGRFEMAEGGTLFLDEIGDISARTQVALLRVLQEKTFERVGGTTPVRANVRVVCATHRDLRAMVERGEFREDLYYRLRGIQLEVPSLRARPGDIGRIAESLLARIGLERNESPKRLSLDAVDVLRAHKWPGNVRELENALRAASLFTDGDVIGVQELIDNVDDLRQASQLVAAPLSLRQSVLPPAPLSEPVVSRPTLPQGLPSVSSVSSLGADGDDEGGEPLPTSEANATAIAYDQVRRGDVSLSDMKRQIERDCIARALAETKGNITKAATLLGMKRPRLSQLVKQYGFTATEGV